MARAHAPEEEAGRGDPLPLSVRRSPLWRWATPALSVAILAMVVWKLRDLDLAQVRSLIPRTPAFWATFAVFYFLPIGIEFGIFRRLWGVPAEGFVALLRKTVGNELLFDYVGEVYFYSWARKRLKMVTSPFGAVKDVAILSALVGNAVTLALVALAWPQLDRLRLGVAPTTILLGVAALMVISIAFLLFGKRVFSLSRGQLLFVSQALFWRFVASVGLQGLLWAMALPQVGLEWWVLLATARMIITRLPIPSNKDVLFTGVAVSLIGDTPVSAMLAMITTIILLAHLITGAVLALGDLVTPGAARSPDPIEDPFA